MNDEVVDNEIDLKGLIQAVLDTRVWVFIILVVATIGFWSLQTAKHIVKPSIYSYEVRVNLVFKGANAGKYPNGTAFSLNDLIAPVILNSAYDTNDLESFISRKDFLNSFSVAPYTPDRSLILNRFASLAENKKLSPTEAQELQTKLNSELKVASASSASLLMSGSKIAKIPDELITTILRGIPSEWARHMVEDVGVAQYDVDIYSAKSINSPLFNTSDYLISFEILLDRIDLLVRNISSIKSMPNGSVTVDKESGYSILELEKFASDIRRYQIAPLINPIRALGIAKNRDVVLLYFENEIVELNREKDFLLQKKLNVEEAYDAYIREGGGRGQTVSGASLQSGSGLIPQIGADFLDKIVDLTKAGADLEYRQELNREVLSLAQQSASVESEVMRIQQILSQIKPSNGENVQNREFYENLVKNKLPLIVAQLVDYFDVSTRIYQKLSAAELGTAGSMYRMTDGVIESSFTNNILSKSNIRLYLIVCTLLIVVAVPILMIRNSMKIRD